jgi:hypothetical protein
MSIDHPHHISKQDIDEAWQLSIEDPRAYWNNLRDTEPDLAAELDVVAGALATSNGNLDIEIKSKILRLGALVYGIMRNSENRTHTKHEVYDESVPPQDESPDDQ